MDNQNTKIDPATLEVIQAEARRIATDVYKELGTQYDVSSTPTHSHNGIDSVQITPQAMTSAFVPLPATPGGVANPSQLANGTINDSSTASNPAIAGVNDSPTIYVDPIPAIFASNSNDTFNQGDAPVGTQILFVNPYNATTQVQLWIRSQAVVGFDTVMITLNASIPSSGNFTLTGALSAGDTHSTLSAPWAGTTGDYEVTTSAGEHPVAALVLGSTSVSWGFPIITPATSTITVTGATSGTLSAVWPYSTGYFSVTFSDATTLKTHFTNGSKAIYWGSNKHGVSANITVKSFSWASVDMTT